MKTASTGLISFLDNTTEYVCVDLYTFTLNGGGVIRYCSSSIPITASIYVATLAQGPYTWNVGPPIEDAGVQSARGGASSADITVLGGDGRFTIGGVDILDFLENFGLDGATIRIDRAYAASWPQMYQAGPVGTFCKFSGLFSEVKELGQTQAVVTVRSPMTLLQTPFPSEVFQTPCLNVFGDSNCSVNVAALAVSSSVSTASVAPTELTFGSPLTQASGYFTLGVVTFTSGANSGECRSVKTYNQTSGAITLTAPVPAPPANGDTFTITPGCSLAMTSSDPNGCQQWQPSTYQTRFRGTPFVPPPYTGLPT